MELQPGSRLGPYEIVERAGAGGMGEVYRARDTRLARSVAIKVLPSEFANDLRLRARLEREAKTISALNHPHICMLHDVGRENGLDYLVLEYCEGRTLAERLERGPLPIDQVLQHGIEISDALSRAHHAGIIHRDLKPSNIMLTKSGVKLLDFGLARADEGSSPTESTAHLISEEGQIVGTIQYMAPELLAGGTADARSDIFALGVVLYETVTGNRAFSGTSKASVMAAILERDPVPIRERRPNVPEALEHVINHCLTKSPDDRWESAHDVAEQLRWIRRAASESKPRSSRLRIAIAAVVIAALLGLTSLWLVSRREGETARVIRMAIPIANAPNINPVGPAIAVSPDGKRITYCAERAGQSMIYVRELDSFEPVALEGTEGAQYPFFSPDGQWIGYFANAAMRKIPVAGGTPQTIIFPLPAGPRGTWWAPDDTIYFSRTYSSGLWKVSASGGGSAQKITEPNAAAGENSHRWPQVLPDGKHVLFTVRTNLIESFDQAKIAVLSLETGRWQVVLDGGTYARYLPTGDLLFARRGALYAVPFDLKSMSTRGIAKQVLAGVRTTSGSGLAEYAVNDKGDLAYVAGDVFEEGSEILAVDRSGHSSVLATLNVTASRPAVSPDGRKIAFNVFRANDDIWTCDLDSGVAARFSFDPGDESTALWTPDGIHIIYSARSGIMMKRADGAGEAEELLHSTQPTVTACSPDGNFVAYHDLGSDTGYDIWLLPLKGGDRKPRPFIRTRSNEWGATFSPDGKWIAYAVNEGASERPEVYVRALNGNGGIWKVSQDGCDPSPRWSEDGKEIFYRRGDEFFSVPLVIDGNEIRPGKPRLLFAIPDLFSGRNASFDVVKGSIVIAHLRPFHPQQINVILNWTRQLVH